MYFAKNIIRKAILCLILLMNITIVLNAQNDMESLESRLSSHIIHIIRTTVQGSVYDPSRYDIIDLFIEVINDRHYINRRGLEQEGYRPRTQLRGEAFALLNETIHDFGFGSDGQDGRNFTHKTMTSLMTLAILSPYIESRFLDIAKSMLYGETWYNYPRQYAAVVFLEVLLEYEEAVLQQQRMQHTRYPVNMSAIKENLIVKLQELSDYLSDVLESQRHDAGYYIEKDIIFINELIEQMMKED